MTAFFRAGLLVFILMGLSHLLQAQNVRFSIKDSDRKGLPGAAIELIKLDDSSKVYAVTDTSGMAVIQNVANNLYQVRISFLGYQTLEKTLSIKDDDRFFEYRLKTAAVNLGEVSVTAQRPLIRQEDDKMIIDPMPLANISTNTLEVLEKTPGMFVDQDGGIFLSSTSPAAVYINGRELKMSTQDITTLLRSIPPGSVEKIEVMRTPSTKYDAASSGGIINIVLKKGVKLGRFGSLSAGMNQGFYGNQFAGASINFSGSSYNAYINANYNHNARREDINSLRTLAQDTTLNQNAVSKQDNHEGYLGYGISWDPNEKLNLSYDGRLNVSFPLAKALNINNIDASEEILLASNDNRTENRSDYYSLQQDFGIIRKFDTLGSNLDTKFGYSYNSNSISQDYSTTVTYPFLYMYQGKGDNRQQRHFGMFQSDLTWYFPYQIKMETGIKSTYQDYQSASDYYNINGDSLVTDADRTNAFRYQESLNAGYIQASKKFGKYLLLKVGVRMEHTYMKGHQSIPSDTNFIVNRADWFPYLYLSRRLFKIMGAELQGYIIYRRTISRPSYQDLNPYIKYVDDFLYETGNPALKPQFTHNIEANISFDDTPIIAIGQNYTTDIFSSVVYPDPSREGVAVRTSDNLGKNVETYARLIIGIPPGKKYFFAIGGQYNYNRYTGVYDGEPLSYKRGSWRFFTFHALSITKTTKLTMYGFLITKGQHGFYELKNFGSLNFGLTQNLFDNKLSISISARDVLKTMKVGFTYNQGTIQQSGDRYTDNQRFGINIRYNFGIRTKSERKGFMQFDMDNPQ